MAGSGPTIKYLAPWSKCALLFLTFMLVYFLALAHGMWDLSSLTRDLTCSPNPTLEVWNPNYWITREVPEILLLFFLLEPACNAPSTSPGD